MAKLMGIVNVTPDSFSDGGLYLDAEAAVAHGRELASQGADIVDVGGESTRPGAKEVPADEELARTEPVVAAFAAMVNDVTALRGDPGLAGLCADRGCEVVLMHMLGTPRTMQDAPEYDDVVDDVRAFLAERVQAAVDSGIAEERIWVDPGIGFGKTVEHNLELLRRLGELGRPMAVGTSRKSFLGRLTGREVTERLGGTIAGNVRALRAGAGALRVHDVREVADAAKVAAAISG